MEIVVGVFEVTSFAFSEEKGKALKPAI